MNLLDTCFCRQKERWCFQLGNKKAASGDRFMRCFFLLWPSFTHSIWLQSRTPAIILFSPSAFPSALSIVKPFAFRAITEPSYRSGSGVRRDLIFMRYSPLSFYCEKSSSARQIARETRDTRLARPSRQFSTRAALTRE
jgi:hypothetical protein